VEASDAPLLGKNKRPWGASVERLIYAHLLSYPAAFAWALALVPVLILGTPEAKWLTMTEEQAKDLILWRVGLGSVAIFAVLHVAALPWAFAHDDRRHRRIFIALLLAVSVLGVGVGGIEWTRLMTR
jgi:hypothetical protein